jgi:hypothetical protein
MQVQQSTKVEFWCLEKLHLADVDLNNVNIAKYAWECSRITYVLQRINSLSRLLDFATNDLRNQLGRELGQTAARSLTLNDLGHLLADGTDLRGSGVSGFLDLVWPTLRECNGKQTEKVIIGGLDGNVRLNQGLPLPNQRAQLVRCEVQPMEVSEAILALNLIDTKFDLAEGVVLVILEIGK